MLIAVFLRNSSALSEDLAAALRRYMQPSAAAFGERRDRWDDQERRRTLNDRGPHAPGAA